MKDTTDETVELFKLYNGNYYLKWSTKCSIVKGGKVEYYDTVCDTWKRTKKFSVITVPYNEIYIDENSDLSWYHICTLADKYSESLGLDLAFTMAAGIVAGNLFKCHFTIYKKIKNLIPSNFNIHFFDVLTCNPTLMHVGMISFDIVWIDKAFSLMDRDYDNEKATYKGKSCSMNDYINKKYGVKYSNIVNLLIKEL